MRPISFLVALCVALSLPVATRAMAPDVAEVRSLIAEGDFETLDTRLHEAQRLFEAGEIEADDTRALYGVFGVVDPELGEFVAGWATAMPDSPYAMVAEGWMHYTAAWTLRGNKTMARTSYDARYLFSAFLDASFDLAITAYRQRPQMLPASDMLVYLSREGRAVQSFDSLIDDIMQRNPNAGTVVRGLGHFHRGWGGTFELGQRLCAKYGPMFEEKWGPHATEACELELVNQYYLDRLNEKHLTWLEEFGDENEILRRIRRGITLNKPLANDAWVADLAEWLAAGNFDSPSALWAFRRYHARPDFYPDLFQNGIKRIGHKARAALRENPYHIAALMVVSGMSPPNYTFVSGIPETTEPVPQGAAREDEMLDFAWRLLEINPYESDYWSIYYRAVAKIAPAHPLLSWIDRNTMAYQNYAASMIFERLGIAEFKITNYQMQIGHAEEFKTDSMMPDRDEMISIYCPAIAQLRLALMQCADNMRHYSCKSAPQKQPVLKQWLRDAEKLDICRVERMVKPRELAADPVPFDDESFVWPRTREGLQALQGISPAGRVAH